MSLSETGRYPQMIIWNHFDRQNHDQPMHFFAGFPHNFQTNPCKFLFLSPFLMVKSPLLLVKSSFSTRDGRLAGGRHWTGGRGQGEIWRRSGDHIFSHLESVCLIDSNKWANALVPPTPIWRAMVIRCYPMLSCTQVPTVWDGCVVSTCYRTNPRQA